MQNGRGWWIAEKSRPVLGWVIGLCLLLQPLWVPLHLVVEEHVLGHCEEPALLPALSHGAHSHAGSNLGHHHHDDTTRTAPGEPEPEPHCPHPAEDHLGQVTSPVGLPKVDISPLALPSVPITGEQAILRTALIPDSDGAPPRPTPRTHAEPRAPPVS